MMRLIAIVLLGFGLTSMGCAKFGSKIQFSVASQTVDESVGTASVTLALSDATSMAVRVPYALSGTATGGGTSSDDYLGNSGTLVIPLGSQSGVLTFPLIQHSSARADRTLVITLGTPENAILGDTVAHTITIQGPGSSPPPTTTTTTLPPPPLIVDATFPPAPPPSFCPGSIYVPVPFSISAPAPIDLVFPLTVTAPGLVQDTDFSVMAPMVPMSSVQTGPSITDVTVLTGGVGQYIEITVDCVAVAGKTITLQLSPITGANLLVDTVVVNF